ncbi:MAG: hypothetical protein ACK4PI_04640 [Tepidisphaerales bacterium]
MAQWIFRAMNPNDDLSGAAQVEEFLGDSDKEFTNYLVREAFQNALDAVHDERQPVTIRIAFGRLVSKRAAEEEWFRGLFDHVRKSADAKIIPPRSDTPCDFLVIEDFNTTGLLGDYSNPTGEEPNNFCNFLFHEAVTAKSGSNLGSRGVGKVVFLKASQIRTWFALTVRHSDKPPKPILAGRAFLGVRHVNGKKHLPGAHFLDRMDETGVRWPIESKEWNERFRTAFSVARSTQPGLSVAIPYVTDVITFEDLRDAIVENFFYAVLQNKLKVHLEDRRTDPPTTVKIDRDCIDHICSEEIRPLVHLARYAIVNPAPALATLQPQPNETQKLTRELVPPEVVQAVRSGLKSGQVVSVRCPLFVHPKTAAPTQTFVDVYLTSAPQERERPTFFRGLLPISHEGDKLNDVRALVRIDQPAIADLLRSAEKASHTKWTSQADEFEKNYKPRKGEIEFVRSIVTRLLEHTREEVKTPQGGVSTDIFSVIDREHPDAIPMQATTPEGPKPGGKPQVPTPPGGDKPRLPYILSKIDHGSSKGFVVKGRPGETPPRRITIEVAYRPTVGSPWSQYDPLDFDFRDSKSELVIHCDGAKWEPADPGNKLHVFPTTDNFKVEVTGFYPLYDIVLRFDDERAEVTA